jgi:hypothetical protein
MKNGDRWTILAAHWDGGLPVRHQAANDLKYCIVAAIRSSHAAASPCS